MISEYLNRFKDIQKTSMKAHDALMFYILFFGGVLFSCVFLGWWISADHVPHNFSGTLHFVDYVLFGTLTYLISYRLIYELFSWNIARSMKTPKYIAPPESAKVAFLTAFVPGNEPYDILENTLKAMSENTYPHDTWLLDEGNDPNVWDICKKYGVYHYSRKGVEKYNQKTGLYKAKTKGGNYNAWYSNFGKYYEFVAQLDVDFVPRKDFLSRTLGYFKDPKVAFVGTPQVYGNIHNSWIARGAAEQTYGFYGPIQKGLYGKGMTLFIGANHVVRVSAHRDIEGYAGHITEDHLTGIKYYAKHWKSVYVPEILAVGEGPTTWESYFSQQMRWAYGSIDILFRESHKYIGTDRLQLRNFLRFLVLEHFYFYGLAQGLGVFLLLLYFAFGIQSANIPLGDLFFVYAPVVIFQFIFFFWLQKFYIDPKYESGFALLGRFLIIASWPVFLIAFFSALFKKKLTYKVTPKGSNEIAPFNMGIFFPHFILGTLTLLCLIVSPIEDRTSPTLLFFAFLNTFFMYFVIVVALTGKLLERRVIIKNQIGEVHALSKALIPNLLLK